MRIAIGNDHVAIEMKNEIRVDMIRDETGVGFIAFMRWMWI